MIVLGKIEGIAIKNYGSLKEIVLGKTFSHQREKPLGNMVTIIGPSGNGKSTIADAFGFIADCLEMGVESACDAGNRGGYEQLLSQNSKEPISFEIYYREANNTRPITYELTIALDKFSRPFVKEERLRYRVENRGWPKSFLHLQNGVGFAFEGSQGGQDDDTGAIEGNKVAVTLADSRKLGIATLGAMKQYSRIEKFLNFLKSWYLCYFTPDAARRLQTAAPQPYLDRIGSNLNNVAQYMYRENRSDFLKILLNIQEKLPGIEKIQPLKMPNGQMVLQFWERGFNDPFFSQKMSDGTLKLFAYYLLLHEKNPRQLVFIEEPENGLYHHYLADLAEEMRKNVGTGYSKQLFVTTHSPFFVNSLPPDDVWVLKKEQSGFSVAQRASDYQFVKDLTEEGVPVGDLWYSKYFG
ncbi:AAA family ATPase [Anaerocolumna jejuensis]|uniref:AAA family ATPase n=1 Tax=Anaerocolumna jejuensis TaxID=259063 RepID=UPI001FA88AF5